MKPFRRTLTLRMLKDMISHSWTKRNKITHTHKVGITRVA